MKWLPRSMAGQLLALLLLAMVAAHLVAVLLLSQWGTAARIHPLSLREIETRVISTYRAVSGHPSGAQSLLENLSLPENRFELASAPLDIPGMDDQEAALARGLHRRLGLPPERKVMVHLRPFDPLERPSGSDQAPNWLIKLLDSGNAWVLDIEVDLPDGRWLRSRHWPSMMHPHWGRVLSFSLPVSVLPMIFIAVLFGRRIMRPLKALTEAARRVSRGERVARLRPEGPSGVREITEAFNDMQERLIHFVNDRTRMIAAIGHDLRTPLTSLRIRAELIDDDELREAMVLTLDEMSVMAEETLQFAQDDATREPTQNVDIGALVGEVVERQRMLGRQVAWTAPPETFYRCRPVHLKRALNNLVDNATRYGNAAVRVLPGGPRQELRIEVEDNGPGMRPEHLEQAFEPFARLDPARSLETGGAGLGLAIARSCIRAHGGEVSLHNRPEGGLCAVIVLPG